MTSQEKYSHIYFLSTTRSEQGTIFDKIVYKVGFSNNFNRFMDRYYSAPHTRIMMAMAVPRNLAKSLAKILKKIFEHKSERYNKEYLNGEPNSMRRKIFEVCSI